VSDHPTSEELEDFLRGGLPMEGTADAVRHLFRCRTCRSSVAPRAAELLDAPRERELPPQGDTAYDRALDQALDRAFAAVREAASDPRGVDPSRLQGLEGYRALLARSWSMRREDPRQMVELARLATVAAEGLDPRRYGEREVADWRAKAWIELANGQRVANDFGGADASLAEAARHLVTGTGNERLRARLLDVKASIEGHRCRFKAAFEALDSVAEIHLRRGDEHLAGRALVSKGLFKGYAGESAEAYELTRRGRALLDESRDPVLYVQALHNEIGLLVDLGRFKEARSLLWLNLKRLQEQGRIGNIKLRGLWGLIHSGLGQLDEAVRELEEARVELQAAGLPYTAAVGGLDLAAVYLQQGRAADAERVIRESSRIFQSIGVPDQGHLAVLLLQKALEQDIASASLIRRTARFLRRVEHDPKAAFS
jgi:tetratricopeptide (TPR) repeat protein